MGFADLTPRNQSIVLGVGLAGSFGLLLSLVTTSRLRAGIPVHIRVDPTTRNLVSATTQDWTEAIDNLSARGVPVRLSLGKKI